MQSSSRVLGGLFNFWKFLFSNSEWISFKNHLSTTSHICENVQSKKISQDWRTFFYLRQIAKTENYFTNLKGLHKYSI